ncbi:MAG: RNA-binding S4 domain-containing protein [Chitinivibrionia bacterium]|nr:RNA-binding S4 domain-containing protein [Chitinivibrionia bacterium]
MRIDLFLKYICLAKSRAKAQTLCDRGAVIINARPAKPSSTVGEGDRIELALPEKTVIIEVAGIPDRQLSKRDAPLCYRILSGEPAAEDDPEF